MEILSYLTELVKTRKEVGITGLGTIYKKKSPGRYDVQTHSFLPPSYALEFTEEVKENNALAEFISKKKNISFDSSSYYVEQFAEELLKQLKDNREADLGELGRLSASDIGVAFSPSGSVDFGFEFYGLPSLKDELAQQEETYAKEQGEHFHERLDLEDHNADLSDGTAEPDEQPVYDEISEIKHQKKTESPLFIETVEDLEEEPADNAAIFENGEAKISEESGKIKANELNSEDEFPAAEAKADHYWNFDKAHNLNPGEPAEDLGAEEIEDKPKTPVYIKVIITVIILVAIAAVAVYFVKPELFKGEVVKEQIKNPTTRSNQLKIDSAAKADSTLKTTQAATAIEDSLKDTAAVLNPTLHADTATTWEVIGASVVKQEVAQVVADMKSRGITGKVIPTMPGKRRIKISIATFYDETSARAGRKALVIKLKNPDLYIYQNKHTHKPE